jgi:hypothetical protein
MNENFAIMNYTDYRQSITNDLAARVANYQRTIGTASAAGILGKLTSPLNLLADGDSWFDYPLDGIIPGINTDIIAQLPGQCAIQPHILNLAVHGDTTMNELGLARTQKIINGIKAAPPGGKFDAILFSGGGNDIAGDQFCIWLSDAAGVGSNPAFALNPARFNGILSVIEASYLDLIQLRDDNLPGAPIFAHGYDFAIPSGVGVCGVGPWLKPSLDFCGWTIPAAALQIVHDAIAQFGNLVARLASNPANNLIFVPTQGTLNSTQWANELHPNKAGFGLMAAKFKTALAAYPAFAGRI